MSQTDYDVADQSGGSFLVDINAHLAAVLSLNSGASALSTTAAYSLWADTTDGVLKQRNAGDSAWLIRSTLDASLLRALSSTATVVVADIGKLITCTGTFTLSLTAAATLTDQHWFSVRNIGSGVITIDPNGAETIDGASTITLNAGESLVVRCNGSTFYTGGRAPLVSLVSGAVSGAASLDLIDLSASFGAYMLIFDDLLPATDNVSLWARTDTNNGASFEAGASDYAWARGGVSSGSAWAGLGSNTGVAIELAAGIDNAVAGSGHIMIHNPMNASGLTRVTGQMQYGNVTGGAESIVVNGGRRTTAEANNAVQIRFNSGNIASMNYTLYGLRAA